MADLQKLNTLSQRINREHRQVQAAFGKTLQHAKRAGELLVQAKERTPHGQWGPWLETNFEFTERTAQYYMQIYSRWSDIVEKTKSVSDLSITGALRAIGQAQATDITRERAEGPLQWPETIELVQASPEGPEAGEEPRERVTKELVQASPEGLEASAQRKGELSEDFSAWSSAERELLDAFRAGESIVVNMHDPGPHTNLVPWLKDANQLVKADRSKKWGNPFIMPYDGDRDTVVRNFEEHYLPYKPSLLNELPYMKGAAWGCWCAPQPCHCDVLKRVAEGRGSAEPKVEG